MLTPPTLSKNLHKNRLKFFTLFIAAFLFVNLGAIQSVQHPKSTVSELNISKNAHYEVTEETDKGTYSAFYGINLFVQAPSNLRGHYAVHDLYGIIGVNYAYQISERWQIDFSPIYHESSHYLDGLLKSPTRADSLKNKFTDAELDGISQECAMLNLTWQLSENFACLLGGGYYYHSTGREINYFLHTAANYDFYKNFCFSGNVSYIDEHLFGLQVRQKQSWLFL